MLISQATSAMRLRLYESAIASRFVFSRKFVALQLSSFATESKEKRTVGRRGRRRRTGPEPDCGGLIQRREFLTILRANRRVRPTVALLMPHQNNSNSADACGSRSPAGFLT